jgi:hypothetical protein
MSAPVPDLAAVDEVMTFFEQVVRDTPPLYAPEQRFRLLGEESGLLHDQPKNAKFFRQFDVRFTGEVNTGESYLPLERIGHVVIMVGYLGSARNRRLVKIIRQDEEQIARHLLRANHESPPNRPFNWDIVPPLEIEVLGQDEAATVVSMTYRVEYVCDEVGG